MEDNYLEKIDSCFEDLINIGEPYLGKDFIQGIKDEYKQKKEDSLLQVMLFGNYNAGKSSLINALMNEEVAAVGDIPKTAVPDRYLWNGCYLLDTPGVNAPIEHEKVTRAQIDRSELILFVIRQDDQDVKDVYDRMFDMIARDKHIFIVFNHELPLESLPEALSRLNGIISEYAKRYGIPLKKVAEIPIIPINIRTAIKARKKGAEVLLEHSGILEFESTFKSWLYGFDNEEHYLDRLKKYIHQCLISPLLSSIDEERPESESAKLQELNFNKQQAARENDQLILHIENIVKGEVIRIRPKIRELIEHSSSGAEAESGLMAIAEEVYNNTKNKLQEYIDNAETGIYPVPAVSIDMSDLKSSLTIETNAGNLMSSVAKNINEDAIKKGLSLLSKLKIPGLDKLGKISVHAGRIAGFIQVAVSIYEGVSAIAEEKRKNEEARKRALAVYQAEEQAVNQISSEIIKTFRGFISEHKRKVIEEIDNKIKK